MMAAKPVVDEISISDGEIINIVQLLIGSAAKQAVQRVRLDFNVDGTADKLAAVRQGLQGELGDMKSALTKLFNLCVCRNPGTKIPGVLWHWIGDSAELFSTELAKAVKSNAN